MGARGPYLVFVLLLLDPLDLGDDVGDLLAAPEALVQLGEGVVVAGHVRQDGLLVRPKIICDDYLLQQTCIQ